MNLSKLKSLNKFSSKGFTLIELLIVIAILGVLAAVVLIAINPGQRIAAARNSRVRADLASMGQKANVFNADTGLSTTCTGGGSYPDVFTASACGTVYMTVAPVPPTGAYALTKSPATCVPNTAIPCTAISISGPAYSDGVVDITTNTTWCWRSASGTITQVTNAAACTP